METTFITILDLSPDANILYSSDSIVDILGFEPEEVVNHSVWEYFHPDELPIARAKHGKGVELDKAAVLSYATMRDKNNHWLGCEVVFTVVYDVIVGCTSIYRRGLKSENRAAEAPVIRRLFSTSPRDPRYHMLSHLSSKFVQRPAPETHEPRAALFLNRYTRTLTIMYATNGLADLLGMTGEDMRGKSFYYCIQENCLQDSVRCLENAKANDSIAYLRFWFRDPRQDDRAQMEANGEEMEGVRSDEDRDIGSVHSNLRARRSNRAHLINRAMEARSESSADSQAVSSASSVEPESNRHNHLAPVAEDPNSRASSGDSNPFTHEAVFGEAYHRRSSASSAPVSPHGSTNRHDNEPMPSGGPSIELEAVVSCTSDGLVVCLRRARPAVPLEALHQTAQRSYANGLFAVPWSAEPIMPSLSQRPQFVQHTEFASGPAQVPSGQASMSQPQPTKPSSQDFMNSIREIAVFAWALNGINGSLASFSRGTPRGESQPAAGLPIWEREAAQHHTFGLDGSHGSGIHSGFADASGSNRASTGIDPGGVFASGGLSAANDSLQPPNFSMPLSSGVQSPFNNLPTNP